MTSTLEVHDLFRLAGAKCSTKLLRRSPLKEALIKGEASLLGVRRPGAALACVGLEPLYLEAFNPDAMTTERSVGPKRCQASALQGVDAST